LRRALGRGPRRTVESEREDPVRHEIGKEILALQSFAFATIGVTASDRRAHGMIVGVYGKHQRARRCGTAAEAGGTLEAVPAVVRAARADVDLLPCPLANVRDEELARGAIEARPPRVAQPERPDLVGARDPDERIVRWHAVVPLSVRRECIAVHAEPEDLAKQTIDILSRAQRVAGTAAITQRCVEMAIAAKSKPPCLVVRECRLVDPDHQRRASRLRYVRIRR
jgi:hypothetical protein